MLFADLLSLHLITFLNGSTYSVVVPVVGCGEEDVVEPESGIHEGDLNPVLTWGEINIVICYISSCSIHSTLRCNMLSLLFYFYVLYMHMVSSWLIIPCCQSSHQKSIPSLSLSPSTIVSQLVTNCIIMSNYMPRA